MRFVVLFLIIVFSKISFAASCPLNHFWVSPHSRKDFSKADGTHVSAALVTGHCRTKSKAYDFWATKIVNGEIANWPYKSEKMKRWSRLDIETLISSLQKVPKGLWKEVRIYRGGSSATKGNPATSADRIIVLYDKAFQQPHGLPRFLTHELAHQMFRSLEEIDSLAYQQAAGWRMTNDRKGRLKFKTDRTKFVAADGDLSPEEDFANNIEYFIYEPERLRQKSPAIYDWISVEYGDRIISKESEK